MRKSCHRFFNKPNPDFPTYYDFIDYIDEHAVEGCTVYITHTYLCQPCERVTEVKLIGPVYISDMFGISIPRVNSPIEDRRPEFVRDMYGYCPWMTVFKTREAAEQHAKEACEAFSNNTEWQWEYERQLAESRLLSD